MTTRALLVVDVQNDFVEGGSLAVTGGKEVAARITAYLTANPGRYQVVVGSKDFHDGDNCNGGHFAEPGTDPNYVTTWPVHCVADTHGSEYAPELDTALLTHHVRKGQGKPAYSMFEGTTEDGRTVNDLLRDLSVDEVDVVGIATDHCVRATALNAAEVVDTRVLLDLCAGVAADTTASALREMEHVGIALGTTADAAYSASQVN
jgi:nicotinamidase/pyrazinamidase